jgi:hypothetical protein
MSDHRYTLNVTTRTASGALVTEERRFTREQQDEAWREWRALREALSTEVLILSYPSGYVLASYDRTFRRV